MPTPPLAVRHAPLPDWVRAIGTYQFACALLAGLTQATFVALYGSRIPAWLAVLALGVTGMGIAGGQQLRHGDRRGLLPTIATQALQVVSVGGGWTFVYLAGPQLAVVMADVGAGVSVGVGGLFHLGPPTGLDRLAAEGFALQFRLGYWPAPFSTASFAVALNVPPLAALVRLLEFCLEERAAPRPRGAFPASPTAMREDSIHVTGEAAPVRELHALVSDPTPEGREAFAAEARGWAGDGVDVTLWYPAAEGHVAVFAVGAGVPEARLDGLRAWLQGHPAVRRIGSFADVFGDDAWPGDADAETATRRDA